MQYFKVVLFMTLGVSLAGTASAGPGGKRVIQLERHELGVRSFEELWNDSAAVVRARVVRAATRVDTAGAPGSPSVTTELRVHVLEEYKGNLSLDPRREMTIHHSAGTASNEDVTVTISGVEPLRAGAEYVVFLGWNKYLGRWVVRSASGVFELRDGKVRAHGTSAVAQERSGKPANALIDELRRIAKQRDDR